MKSFIREHKILAFTELAVIALILLFGIFSPKYNKTYTANELENHVGIMDSDGNLHVDDSISGSMLLCSVPEFPASYGQYTMTVRYSADTDDNYTFMSMVDSSNGTKAVDVNSLGNHVVVLRQRTDEAVCEFFLHSLKGSLTAHIAYNGGSLTVSSITISKNPLSFMKPLLIMLTIFGVIDSLVVLRKKRLSDEANGRINDKFSDSSVFLGAAVIAIAVFASIPLFVNYMIKGFDLDFHLLRIEGIKDALTMGVWPVKIQPNWLCGNGYATSVFYGDALLYIPALLRLFGFSIMEAYNIFVFLVNLATALISYHCFKKISGSNLIGLIGSMIYTLSIYRLVDLYVRSSVGEYTALIFLPLLVYGLWKIYTEDSSSEKYKLNWLLPTIAFTGIIQSHLLTTEMAGALTVLFCLINFKKTFRKDTFFVLLKTVIFSILINIGFFIPFLDYMVNGSYVVQTFTLLEAGIQQHGVFLSQILLPFAQSPGINNEMFSGINGESPYTTGAASILGICLLAICMLVGYEKDKEKKKMHTICFWFAILCLWASTCYFPWNRLQNLHAVLKQIIVTIQFPWRFLGVAAVFMAAATVVALRLIKENKTAAFIPLTIVIACLSLTQSGSFLYGVLNESSPSYVYSAEEIDNCYLIGSEYLPSGGEAVFYSGRNYISELDEARVISRTGNRITFHVENNSDEAKTLNTIMVKYPGYVAKDVATNAIIPFSTENNYHVELLIPAHYSGDIKVYFSPAWYWTLGYVISIATIVLLALYLTKHAYMRKKREKLDVKETD